MKKMLVPAIVGGLIIFIWQFLSFAAINFHKPAQQYTDKQDAILSFLQSQQLPEGGYVMPMLPDGSSMDDHEKLMNDSKGKPWASIQYHAAVKDNMVMNMIRGFLVDVIIVWLFCWLLARMNLRSFGNIVTAALVTGFIVFLNAPYTGFIWYETFDIWAYLADAVVSWGLVGVWLAWWFGRKRGTVAVAAREERAEAVA